MNAPHCPYDEWVTRFAGRFRELQPMVSESQSTDVGSAAFASSNDLAPEESAAVFSEILDASVPLPDLSRAIARLPPVPR